MKEKARKAAAGIAVLLFWVLLWEAGAVIVGKELLLPSPRQVLGRFLALAGTGEFWKTIAVSLVRVSAGIASAVVLGVVLALLTERFSALKMLLSPAFALIKSTPVASFIILALVWLGRSVLPGFITALMVLPVVWANVSAGIAQRDEQLLEVAAVFEFTKGKVLRRITIPTVLPHFRAALASALALGWKAGIAAEVLTVPQRSIGRMIYESKLYLETTDLFAWTMTVILLSVLIEKLMLRFVQRIGQGRHDGNA